LCAAALGSETDGSITSPASCNALVGIKATIGLISRGGVIPVAVSQDTVGPLARTVADAAALLTAIADFSDDPYPAAALPNRVAVDYTKALDPNALRGARIGVPRKNFFGTNRNVDALMTTALAKLVELGAVLVDPADLKVSPELGPAEAEVFFAELKTFMDAYLAARPPPTRVRSLADLVAFNKQHADREMHYFGQENFDQALTKVDGITAQSYLDARAKCIHMTRDLIDGVMADQKLDAFVAATSGPTWLIDPINGDTVGGANAYTLPAIAGYPHVSVPGGAYLGLPVGLSFFGAPYTEAKLLGYAFAYEQATKHRKPPRFLATAELA
jgi:amidase